MSKLAGRITLVCEMNNAECSHGVGAGFVCDDCSRHRGQLLIRKLAVQRREIEALKAQLAAKDGAS